MKKPIFKRWWFWVIIVIVIIAVVGASGGSGDNTDSGSDSTDTSNTQNETNNVQEEIVYEVTDLRTMIDELDANAMKAEQTYQNKYVEVKGNITNFDSDGSYISIEPVNADEFSFTSVMCYIKTDDQKQMLLEKSVGDTVVIKGKVKSVGELLGYSIDIAEIA